MVITIAILIVISIIVLRTLVRQAAIFVVGMASSVPPKLGGTQAWKWFQSFQVRLAERYPRVVTVVAQRIDPQRPTGLLLSLMVLAGFYLFALFGGLTEDILEAQGTIHSDNMINAALGPWRIEPFISAFLWVTNLGSTPAIVAAVIIATGFLWPQRGTYVVVSLWITCLGAVTTTSIGKLLVARHRPDIMFDANATGWSFPSGHATAAMAVYGFIAYAIARALPGFRERFEVVYWAAVLVALIGFSRIFLGVHYVTDVIGGFLVGGFWLLVGFALTEWKRPYLTAGISSPERRLRGGNEENRR
ncbi:phosphatase PAP2 family protein [Microbacteriaceae bacterium K1510]|nr:phosphatase PAP2 family protein [Microbacteriaceae bacterium K1510]